tara:strand:- start:10953 stop:11279 length:327 start_codon:yes stop_codon:yes gene_type:complete
MKRVKFKKELANITEALNKVPNELKENMNIFEMTDGNKTFKVRWEGTLEEGNAVALEGKNTTLINEDFDKIKHLMGYKSEDTLGTIKGEDFVNENNIVRDLISGKKKA